MDLFGAPDPFQQQDPPAPTTFGAYRSYSPPLRGPRRLYYVRAESFAWFRRVVPVQGELFEQAYHVGYWRVFVCRVCLLAELAALSRAHAVLHRSVELGKQRIVALAAQKPLREPAER